MRLKKRPELVDKTPRTEAFWQHFCRQSATAHGGYDVVGFGDSPAMMDELGALVVSGRKRATAGLLRDFILAETPVPAAGDFVVVVQSDGEPLCIYQSTDVRIGPLSSVDAQFAWDEGEGDRSRDWWLAAHRDFFQRQAAVEDFAFHDDIETVFERFRVVWPADLADR